MRLLNRRVIHKESIDPEPAVAVDVLALLAQVLVHLLPRKGEAGACLTGAGTHGRKLDTLVTVGAVGTLGAKRLFCITAPSFTSIPTLTALPPLSPHYRVSVGLAPLGRQTQTPFSFRFSR